MSCREGLIRSRSSALHAGLDAVAYLLAINLQEAKLVCAESITCEEHRISYLNVSTGVFAPQSPEP